MTFTTMPENTPRITFSFQWENKYISKITTFIGEDNTLVVQEYDNSGNVKTEAEYSWEEARKLRDFIIRNIP